MGSHHLNLKWRNHHSNLLSVFSQLLTSEAFADVTLACDGASLRAHKLILSACSPFFHSLFAQHPCQHPIVILKDVPYDDLKVLVDFMYHGEVNIAQERLPSFLRTAEALKVKGLSESEAHNRIGPMKPFNATSNSHQKSTEKRYAAGMSPKPACKKPKRSDNVQDLGQSSGLVLPGPLASMSDKIVNSPSHDSNLNSDTAEPIEPKTEELTPRNEDSHDDTTPREIEHADGEGPERIISDGSMLQILPQTSDASSSDNILEVESYRQLQRMAGLLAYSGTSSPSRPQFGFNLPAYSGRIPNEDDEDEDDEDKDSSEQGKVDEVEESTPVNEDVHALTKLPRHKKKDCIVCGNRAAGLRRRSRQWCPGCNVGVHVHCFEKLVHFRRHPRRSRSEPNNSAQLNTLPHNTLQHTTMQQLALPFTTAYTKIT